MKTRATLAEKFAALSAAVYNGVFIYDSGVVVDATKGAAALFGRTRRELDRVPASELFTDETRHTLTQHLGSLVHGSCPAMALKTDGTRVPVLATVQAHLTLNGRRLQVVALRDTTSDDQVAGRKLGRY